MIGPDLLPTATALLKAVRMQTELSPWADRLWETVCLADPLEMMYARDVWWAMGILAPKGDRRMEAGGVPKVRRVLHFVRYCHVAALWDREARVATVAERVGFCHGKALDQHLRLKFGLSATKMRDTVPFPMAREQLLDQIVRPYRYDWALLATGPYFERAEPRKLVAA